MTAYALLCFLGAGYDHHEPSANRTTVRKGIDYLCAHQGPDGRLGVRNYEHAIATLALVQAYAESADPDLEGAAQHAIDAVLTHQNREAGAVDERTAGLGWGYRYSDPAHNDSSVSAWNVLALASAAAAGLEVGNGLVGARQWLVRAWRAANSDWATLTDPATAVSGFPYRWDAQSGEAQRADTGASGHDLAPAGALCAAFLGHPAGSPMLESLANRILQERLPASYPCNTYDLVLCTLALFQLGGERWTRWNNVVRDMLVKAQHSEPACFAGSWDWQGTSFPGQTHGRLLSTAYCCLCLEVYFLYQRGGGGALTLRHWP